MKKIALSAMCFVLLGSNFIGAATTKAKNKKQQPKLVSIDSILLMQKSKEGQLLAQRLQKDVEGFQNFAKNAQKEITDFQETVQKQAKALSKEALLEKGEILESMRKSAERQLTDKETDLKRKIQKEQTILRDRQMAVVSEFFEEKKWGFMLDKNTPGLLLVANSEDKTDVVLKFVDGAYEKELAQNVIEKETTKKSVTTKTTKAA